MPATFSSQSTSLKISSIFALAAFLRELGDCEVKHGVKVSIVNLDLRMASEMLNRQKFRAVQRHRARVRWLEVVSRSSCSPRSLLPLFFFSGGR